MTSNNQTLLDKAKAFKPKNRNLTIGREQIDLAIAWAKDEISYSQAAFAFGKNRRNSMSVYIDLARSLRQAFINGTIKENK